MELTADGRPNNCQVQNKSCARTASCQAFVAAQREQVTRKRSEQVENDEEDGEDDVPRPTAHGPVVQGGAGLPNWIPWAGRGPVVGMVPRPVESQ